MQRTITETSPDFILVISLDGTIQFINRVLDAEYNRDVVGSTIYDYVGPDERAKMIACFERVKKTGELDRYESTYNSPGHGVLNFDCRVAPIFRNKSIIGLTINASDVTHQKRIEKALRDAMQNHSALIENSPVGIISISPDGTILSANPAFHHMLDAESPTLEGAISLDLVHPDDVAISKEHLQDLVGGVRDTCKSELRFRRNDGRYIWSRFSASTICDDEGNFLRLVCVVEDITDRRSAERHQRMLMSELDHRVKNNLQSLVSLAEQSIATSESLEAFEHTFIGRVTAMARSHEALAQSQWTDLELRKALTMTLATHLQETPPRIRLEGPPVKLVSRTVMPLCLTMHELATNAMRHGALSTTEGFVTLAWSHDDNMLRLKWRESGGPRCSPPTRVGLGTQLIEGFVTFELHGTLDMRFVPTGLECDIALPTTDVDSQ